MIFIPNICRMYWICLISLSIFATNLVDFLLVKLALSHTETAMYLLLGLAIIFLSRRLASVNSPILFWPIVMIIISLATIISDMSVHSGFDTEIYIISICSLFFAAVTICQLIAPPTLGKNCIFIDYVYLTTLFVASLLGATVYDVIFYSADLEQWGALVVFGIPLGLLLYAGHSGLFTLLAYFYGGRGGLLVLLAYYWIVFTAIRSTGIAAGDLLVRSLTGIDWSTAASGLAFILVVGTASALGRRRDSPDEAHDRAAST